MAKIKDLKLLLELKNQGKTLKQMAEVFGCSPVAIWKKLQKLCPEPLPESFEKLTDRQKKFVLGKLEGKNNVQAATEAFDVTNSKSAKSIGSRLMKDPDVKTAIDDLMAQVGLNRRYLLQRLKTLVDHPDATVTAKGLDLSFKINRMTLRQEEDKRPVIYISSEKLAILDGTAQLVKQYQEGKLNLEEYEQQNLIAGQQEEPTE